MSVKISHEDMCFVQREYVLLRQEVEKFFRTVGIGADIHTGDMDRADDRTEVGHPTIHIAHAAASINRGY